MLRPRQLNDDLAMTIDPAGDEGLGLFGRVNEEHPLAREEVGDLEDHRIRGVGVLGLVRGSDDREQLADRRAHLVCRVTASVEWHEVANSNRLGDFSEDPFAVGPLHHRRSGRPSETESLEEIVLLKTVPEGAKRTALGDEAPHVVGVAIDQRTVDVRHLAHHRWAKAHPTPEVDSVRIKSTRDVGEGCTRHESAHAVARATGDCAKFRSEIRVNLDASKHVRSPFRVSVE